MSFETDIPNYKNFEDGDLYYNDLPSGIKSAMQGLIRSASGGDSSILKDIINSVAEKTGAPISTGWSWNDLENDIPSCVNSLYRQTESKGFPFFMDSIEIIYRKGELSLSELNEWLEDNRMGYRCESIGSRFSWFLSKDIDDNDNLEVTSENTYIADNKDITTVRNVSNNMNKRVFVVHGHDELAKVTVARSLEKMGFEPIILHEQANLGKTIIEKFEMYSDVAFAVVLYTECDVGRDKNLDESENRNRARQNVVFEHGYLIGKLGRERVCALIKGDVEIPGDISGVVFTLMYDNNAWEIELYKNMKAVGINVDLNKL